MVRTININRLIYFQLTLGADKSLARAGRKQAAPVKSAMGRGMD